MQSKAIFQRGSDTKNFPAHLYTIVLIFPPRAITYLNLGFIYQPFYFSFPTGSRNAMDLYTCGLKGLGTKQNTFSKLVPCFFCCVIWGQFSILPESQFPCFWINTVMVSGRTKWEDISANGSQNETPNKLFIFLLWQMVFCITSHKLARFLGQLLLLSYSPYENET